MNLKSFCESSNNLYKYLKLKIFLRLPYQLINLDKIDKNLSNNFFVPVGKHYKQQRIYFILEESSYFSEILNEMLDENDIDNKLRDFPLVKSKTISDLQLLIQEKMDYFGSDKGTYHGYHKAYGQLLSSFHTGKNILKLLEIGVGTKNILLPSNMGKNGVPGASLRAWKNVFPYSQVYGADIDEKLTNIPDINCFYLDQRLKSSWVNLGKLMKGYKIDLLIDDGLHSISTNLNSLQYAIRFLNPGGIVVIEDVPDRMLKIWAILIPYLEKDWNFYKYKGYKSNLIIAKLK